MLRAVNTLLKKSDRRRWANTGNIYSAWDSRSKLVAALVPNNSRVIEFGAGRRVLEQYLDSSCSYVPSDIVDRGPGTIVFDLNERPLPDLGVDVYDVAVLIGVLEYLRELPEIVDWLAKYVAVCVVTYACATTTGHSPRALFERFTRVRHGWVNNYREDQLRAIFRERGFEIVQDEKWEKQRIFVFTQRSLSS